MWAAVPAVRFIQYGLGPIGLGIAELALDRGFQLAGAYDIDPTKVGRPLSELLSSAPTGIFVATPAPGSSYGRADIALHSTQSRIAQVFDQLTALIDAGIHVISTCEELAFPWRHHPREAAELDRLAVARRVTVIGLGVNPGFVMDALPVILAAPCRTIERIVVERVVDVGRRRQALRQKVGVGLSVEAFREGIASGLLAHVGLPQSVAMVADAIGWDLRTIDESVDPVLGPDGSVRGLHQVCKGFKDTTPIVTLDLTMAIEVNARDAIRIYGTPPLVVEIPRGVQGDAATSSIVVNAIPQVLAAAHGLRVATELPPRLHRPSR